MHTDPEEVKPFPPEAVRDFARWVETHPSGFVLVSLGADSARLHEADCTHIAVYTGAKGKGTYKWAARRIGPLRSFAAERGLAVRWCESCMS